MDEQSINSFISEEVCIADKLCNPKHPSQKEAIDFCKEYLDGFNDNTLKSICENYKPQECLINECNINILDNLNPGEVL